MAILRKSKRARQGCARIGVVVAAIVAAVVVGLLGSGGNIYKYQESLDVFIDKINIRLTYWARGYVGILFLLLGLALDIAFSIRVAWWCR